MVLVSTAVKLHLWSTKGDLHSHANSNDLQLATVIQKFQCKLPIHALYWLYMTHLSKVFIWLVTNTITFLKCFTTRQIGRWHQLKYFSLHSVMAVFISPKSSVKYLGSALEFSFSLFRYGGTKNYSDTCKFWNYIHTTLLVCETGRRNTAEVTAPKDLRNAA